MLQLKIHRKEIEQPIFDELVNRRNCRCTFVPPVKTPPRAPFGPSDDLKAGIPLEGIDFDLQKSAATRRDT